MRRKWRNVDRFVGGEYGRLRTVVECVCVCEEEDMYVDWTNELMDMGTLIKTLQYSTILSD